MRRKRIFLLADKKLCRSLTSRGRGELNDQRWMKLLKCGQIILFCVCLHELHLFSVVSCYVFIKEWRCRDEGHLDKLCSRVSSASCRTVGLVLTSWGGRRPSARQQSPASAPRGRRCRCRSLDTRSSPARLTHTGETGRSKIRWKSREREARERQHGWVE